MSAAHWWHPVADVAALASAPQAVTLLGEDLVLWRDAAGAVHAFTDRCPHRGTRLSLGRVCDGQLECAYHGWRFAGSGACVQIPALPQFEPPASHRVAAFAVTLAYGLVWVRLVTPAADETSAASAQPPPFAAETDPHLRKLLVGPYDVATSAPRIVENFLDLAHFGFVHEGVLGDRAHTDVPAYQVMVSEGGLLACGCLAWQPQANRRASGGAWVAYDYAVPAPYAAVLTKVPEQQDGQRESIALFVCPVEPERSRVWFRMAGADFESSDDDLRAFQRRIFTQDQPVLESQRPKLLPLSGHEAHSAADRMSAAYRRWLRDTNIEFGVA